MGRPFVMATVNTKNIHRSNLLLNHRYGVDFVYDEMFLPGRVTRVRPWPGYCRGQIHGHRPHPAGRWPTREQRETGFYDLLFVGATGQGETLRASVKGDMDPGYGSTSKMIAETAVACSGIHRPLPGYLTPAAALGRVADRPPAAQCRANLRAEQADTAWLLGWRNSRGNPGARHRHDGHYPDDQRAGGIVEHHRQADAAGIGQQPYTPGCGQLVPRASLRWPAPGQSGC